jgi:hypothetical protein
MFDQMYSMVSFQMRNKNIYMYVILYTFSFS